MKRHRKYLLVLAQAVVSVAALVWIARQVDLTDSIASLMAIPAIDAATATAIMGFGMFAAALRWGALLRNASIDLGRFRLFRYYLMGLFFSLFLPTSVGGDAFRVYVVGRSADSMSAALFATLQERALGLGGAMAVSLAVMPVAAFALPAGVLPSVLAFQLVAVVGTVFVIYPSLALRLWHPVSRFLSGLRMPWMHSAEIAARVEGAIAKLDTLMRRPPRDVPLLVLLAMLPAIVIGFAHYWILRSMGVEISPAVLMLIVPMVWIVRLLPISLGGIGIGEGAFVLLAVVAGIDRDKAFAAALAILAIQVAWALVGGLLFLRSGLKRAFAAYSEGAG